MAVLAWSQNVCAIFSNISDFAVYERTMARYMPSRHLRRLDKPLVARTPFNGVVTVTHTHTQNCEHLLIATEHAKSEIRHVPVLQCINHQFFFFSVHVHVLG